jgi:hypothetical protein
MRGAIVSAVEDQDSGNLTLNHFRWKIVPPTAVATLATPFGF